VEECRIRNSDAGASNYPSAPADLASGFDSPYESPETPPRFADTLPAVACVQVYTNGMRSASAVCNERKILKQRYRARLKVFFDATARLERCQSENFDRASKYAERARVALENTCTELDSHISTHGCG
jgi:hypothetical protein